MEAELLMLRGSKSQGNPRTSLRRERPERPERPIRWQPNVQIILIPKTSKTASGHNEFQRSRIYETMDLVYKPSNMRWVSTLTHYLNDNVTSEGVK